MNHPENTNQNIIKNESSICQYNIYIYDKQKILIGFHHLFIFIK
jgi:hypothetical protein